MPLRLVHVSDIHFMGYGDGWDLDADQRNELLRDVRILVARGGPVDGILVGGDIAFRAASSEYESARRWLDELREACGGLDAGRVWTVPGNHDVDRSTINASPALQEFRTAVRERDLAHLDATLSDRLAKDPTAEGLMAPLQAYNAFAGEYTCAVTSREPHWFDDSLEFDGLRVRLLGLNSVLISDKTDSDTTARDKLVLGVYQCQIPRSDDTIHIVIAHHPPTWIRDWPNVEPYLRRAHLLLFGHEHSFGARQLDDLGPVEVHAGAVGPERVDGQPEGPYAPTYNVLTLARSNGDTVEVTIEPRYWDHGQTRFGPHPDGVRCFAVAIAEPPAVAASAAEPPLQAPGSAPTAEARPANPLGATDDTMATGAAAAQPTQRPTELRRIGTEYMRRPWTERINIGRALGVLDDHDLQMPDAELFPLVLRRIREQALVPRLIEELDRG